MLPPIKPRKRPNRRFKSLSRYAVRLALLASAALVAHLLGVDQQYIIDIIDIITTGAD